MPRFLTCMAARSAAVAALALVLAACNGDNGGGPAAPAPGVPVISNLNASLQGGCTLRGRAGTVLSETVNYSDSDGNVRGGTLQTTGRFDPSGQSIDLNFALPSEASVTGTTEGTIQAFACVVFGTGTTGLTLSVALLDAAGNSSNILSTRVSRLSETRPGLPAGETSEPVMERLHR